MTEETTIKRTRAYFGDGVYGEFDGWVIILSANGIGANATDRIYFEPGIIELIAKWIAGGHRDHATGKTFEDT